MPADAVAAQCWALESAADCSGPTVASLLKQQGYATETSASGILAGVADEGRQTAEQRVDNLTT
jgi:hypothetical protein